MSEKQSDEQDEQVVSLALMEMLAAREQDIRDMIAKLRTECQTVDEFADRLLREMEEEE